MTESDVVPSLTPFLKRCKSSRGEGKQDEDPQSPPSSVSKKKKISTKGASSTLWAKPTASQVAATKRKSKKSRIEPDLVPAASHGLKSTNSSPEGGRWVLSF